MMATIIQFPDPQSQLDKYEKLAKEIIIGSLVRAFEEGGNQAAEDLLLHFTWTLAKMSANIIGAKSTEYHFVNAGRHGYNRDEVRP